MGWLVLTYAVSLTTCPVMAMPAGYTKGGLPIGLQVIGAPRGEAALFATAAYVESILGVAGKTPLDPVVR
jgi:amidase